MMKIGGRNALIAITGIFILLGGMAEAAPSSTSDKPDNAGAVKANKHRHHALHRSVRTTAGSAADKPDKQASASKTESANADGDAPGSSQMPPEIANANAQFVAADTPTAAAASAMTGRANDNLQAAAGETAAPKAETQVVEPDQINEIDSAVQQDPLPAQRTALAATETQPRPAPVMASSQSSAWDQSSLIGKIFIGVGTLLTLASAARMFMA